MRVSGTDLEVFSKYDGKLENFEMERNEIELAL